jgi:hypothetical protein
VLIARAADMVGREEMDCRMGELAELVLGASKVASFSRLGLAG